MGEYSPAAGQKGPPPELRERVEAELGQKASGWRTPPTGLSAAHRYIVSLDDGSRAFVKAAVDEDTERWLRNEHVALQHAPAHMVPGIMTWLDGPGFPVLITEDLSHARWPATFSGTDWRDGDIDNVLRTVAELSALPAPPSLPTATNEAPLWPNIEGQRDAFLEFGLCSDEWLSVQIDALANAEASLDRTGDRFVHGDMRSDNICFVGGRVVLVDWSSAARGSSKADLANLLPTLELEGGPRPYYVLPDASNWASAGAASVAQHTLDDNSAPEWLRKVFLRLIGIHLSWAASCLALPQPDGLTWRDI